MTLLQEKGSTEVVFKAMGRAINKTVTIVELIKIESRPQRRRPLRVVDGSNNGSAKLVAFILAFYLKSDMILEIRVRLITLSTAFPIV